MERFTEKAAIVTGGATGIGFAIAQRILAEGGAVTIAGRRQEEGDRAVRALNSDRVIFVATDVTKRPQVDDLIAQALERFGRLDVLVNNAGVGAFAPFRSLKAEHLRTVLDVNLSAIVYASQAALPHLLATVKGRAVESTAIVNVASISGTAGDPGMAAYNAAKAGAINLTRSMAIEFAPQGVRVNAVSPGIVDTPMGEHVTKIEALNAAFIASVPLRRIGRPSEIAAAVAFAASEEAGFLVGANIVVDGGTTAGTGQPDFIAHFMPR